MRRAAAVLLALGLAGTAAAAAAADTIREFDDPAQRERYEALISEVRCMVCQNESLASSQADLAQDMRNEIYRMVREGYSRDEALDFLVARYGDFVLYRPPVKPSTWLLWFGPLLMLAAGGVILAAVVRARRRAEEPALSAEEHARAARLLGETDTDDDRENR